MQCVGPEDTQRMQTFGKVSETGHSRESNRSTLDRYGTMVAGSGSLAVHVQCSIAHCGIALVIYKSLFQLQPQGGVPFATPSDFMSFCC